MFLKYSRLVMLTNSVVLTYCIFFVDWGPHEHVFSGVLILLSLRELTPDSFLLIASAMASTSKGSVLVNSSGRIAG